MAKHKIDKHLVSLTSPSSFAAEQYQGLRLKMERLARTSETRVIAITSPGAGDGKTLTAINLAGALVHESDANVLLIDADLRRPAIGARLGLNPRAHGLSDFIRSERLTIDDVTEKLPQYRLAAISAGSTRSSVHHVLRSPRLKLLLDQARARYDFVILDTPPLLPVFDSAVLSGVADGLILVVAANHTPRKLLGEALNLLDPAKLVGLVFNRDERPLFGYYRGYYNEYFANSSGMA
jgi:capsular exopolysaccharide synthesis family protein